MLWFSVRDSNRYLPVGLDLAGQYQPLRCIRWMKTFSLVTPHLTLEMVISNETEAIRTKNKN